MLSSATALYYIGYVEKEKNICEQFFFIIWFPFLASDPRALEVELLLEWFQI